MPLSTLQAALFARSVPCPCQLVSFVTLPFSPPIRDPCSQPLVPYFPPRSLRFSSSLRFVLLLVTGHYSAFVVDTQAPCLYDVGYCWASVGFSYGVDSMYYFAYGTNMSESKMRALAPFTRREGARLEGF